MAESTKRKQATSDESSRQPEASSLSVHPDAWREAAKRRVFGSKEGHWSSSLTVWLIFNCLDAAITWLCLSEGMTEANPFLTLAIQTGGLRFMIAVKISLALLLGILIWKRGNHLVNNVLNMGMAFIVILNCLLVAIPLWSLNLSG
jgi:hypothetical protein